MSYIRKIGVKLKYFKIAFGCCALAMIQLACLWAGAPVREFGPSVDIPLEVVKIPAILKRGEKGDFVLKTDPKNTCLGMIGYYEMMTNRWKGVDLENIQADEAGLCQWNWAAPHDAKDGSAGFRAAVEKNGKSRDIIPQSFCIEICPGDSPDETGMISLINYAPAPSPTPLPVGKNWKSLSSFAPGQYVSYHYYNSNDYYIKQLPDGEGQVFTQDVPGIISLTPDGRKLLIEDGKRYLVFDYEKSELRELPAPPKNCRFANGSPDLDQFALDCKGEIRIMNIPENRTVAITKPSKFSGDFLYPLWSPNGKWISYINLMAPFEKDPDDGLHFIDTSCLAKPEECPQKTRGPYYQKEILTGGPYTWSPDGQKLAFNTFSPENPVKIFSIQSGTFKNFPQPQLNDQESYAIAWSPDGAWVGYTYTEPTNGESQILLSSIDGKKRFPLMENSRLVELDSWLTVPWPFRAGDLYQITQEGANLNLRKSPGLDSVVAKRLMEKEKIQILEGPIDKDGYHWWRIKALSSGVEGWAADLPNWYIPVK